METINDILERYSLPFGILGFIIKDTDDTIYYDLENIEIMLDNGATAYSDLIIYDEIANVKYRELQ